MQIKDQLKHSACPNLTGTEFLDFPSGDTYCWTRENSDMHDSNKSPIGIYRFACINSVSHGNPD